QGLDNTYPLSLCMSSGCCLEACPQHTKVELLQQAGEADEQDEQRKGDTCDPSYIGAHAISQAVLFNLNPTGKRNAGERYDALSAPGGLQVCGNAQNCVAVCPKEIPLTTSIGRAGRGVTVHKIKQIFGD